MTPSTPEPAPPSLSLRDRLSDPWVQAQLHFLWLFLVFWGIYALSGALKPTWFNAHVHLADAMLHGRFHLVEAPKHFEMTVVDGKTYLAYGIGPTLLMLPFVAVFGLQFHQALFCAAVGALAVAFWWRALGKMGLSEEARNWLTAAYGLGSLFWYWSGQNGNTWSFMHVALNFGLMVAINEVLGKQRAWIVGLGFGLAVLSRQTVFLALPFFVFMLWRDDRATGGRGIVAKAVGFAAGLGALLGFNAFYNWARFGNPMDNGYAKVIADNLGTLEHGNFGLYYLWSNIQGYFLRVPEKIGHFPWFDPTMDGFSVFISMPALIYMARADWRQRINWLALIPVVGILGFYLIYHWSGYAQFGRRYTLDFLPFCMLLIASGLRNRVTPTFQACVYFAALVEFWGIYWWAMKGW